MTDRIRNAVEPLVLGRWRFDGFLGNRIRAMADARILSSRAQQEIYLETEEAFRLRVDDRSYPGRGVWRGEFWGKWLLSAIAASRYYRSDSMQAFIARAVEGLLTTQDADGYIGTYHDPAYFGPSTWNIWCRKYTLWGLLEAWQLLGDDAVLDAAARLGEHLLSQVGPGGYDIVRTGQFYGLPSTSILKPVVMLYRATDDPRFLRFAEHIVDQWARHPSGLPDLLNRGLGNMPIHAWFPASHEWAKSYELISCVEGLVELYRVTGEASYLQATRNIHAQVVAWERSPVGSISFNDKFVGSRYLTNTVAEICDAVYWNRLSFELLLLTGEAGYVDEIERTLYNALLCGMKLDGTWGLRRLRLSHEHIPAHNHFLKHHQCCVDNLPRGLFQAAETAVFVAPSGSGVYLALYAPGAGSIRPASGQNVRLSLRGDFIEDGRVVLTVSPDRPAAFPIHLRMPAWSAETVVRVGGEEAMRGEPGTWLRLERRWQERDEVEIRFDVRPRAERFDATRIPAGDPRIAWHVQEWASMGVVMEDNLRRTTFQRKTIGLDDALPQRPAITLFRGPLALAQDIRLGEAGIYRPLPTNAHPEAPGDLHLIPAPPGIWKAFELQTNAGPGIRFCDFASAGNTWDRGSEFNTWIPLVS